MCRANGRPISYGIVEGAPTGETARTIVLIHGWALAHSSYGRAAQQLAAHGFDVLVPDLPGFGGSPDLPLRRVSLDSFARVISHFLTELGYAGKPVHLVGHSFGGAVAAQVAHDYPAMVASVVLVDSVSGATWTREDEAAERLLTDRPLWDWGVRLVQEFPFGGFPGAAGTLLRDLGRNVAWHLPSLGAVAGLIRRSDLRGQLEKIASADVPVAVVWAEGDRVITRASFEDQCRALGCQGTVVEGNHGWPIADPSSFGRLVADLLEGPRAAPVSQPA